MSSFQKRPFGKFVTYNVVSTVEITVEISTSDRWNDSENAYNSLTVVPRFWKNVADLTDC